MGNDWGWPPKPRQTGAQGGAWVVVATVIVAVVAVLLLGAS